MIYGYARVSTQGQELETQLQALENEGAQKIYSEKFTGTKVNRPRFNELLEVLAPGDTLVVTKLDRLARNTKEGIQIIEDLFEKGVKVHVMNVGMLSDTTIGRFFLQTLLAVAELERNIIIERMAEGKAVAKQKDGFSEGRPRKYNKDREEMAMALLKDYSLKEVSKMTGISTATLSRYKAKRKDLE